MLAAPAATSSLKQLRPFSQRNPKLQAKAHILRQSSRMAQAWKAAGLSYNRYLAIAARVVRRSLKEGPRLQAERRGEMDLRFARWENGKQGEMKSLATANEQLMQQNAESK